MSVPSVYMVGGHVVGSSGAVFATPAGSGFFADPYSSYTTYYLDPVNGNDSWTGTSRTAVGPNGPFLTLQHAVNQLTAGGIRVFCLVTGTCVINTSNIVWPTNTGTSASARVVLQGDPAAATPFPIELENGALLFPNQNASVNWVVFRKLEVFTNNSIGSPISGETALIWYGPDHICTGMTVEYCYLHDVYGSDNTGWIFFQGVHSNFVFWYNKMKNCYNSGGTSNHNGGGIFTYQTPNVIVQNNDLSFAGALIYMKRCSPSTGAVNGWTIDFNIFHDSSGNDAILVSEQAAGDIGGFFGITVQNNLFYNLGQCIDQNNSENTIQSSGFNFINNTIAQDVQFGAGFKAMDNVTWELLIEMASSIQVNFQDTGNSFTNTSNLWNYNAILTTQGQTWFSDHYGANAKTFNSLPAFQLAHTSGAVEFSVNPDANSVGFTSIPTNMPNYTSRNYDLAPGSPLKGIGPSGQDPGCGPNANLGPGW